MIIHKQDVTLTEDILQILQDYISHEILVDQHTELELEMIKESVSKFSILQKRMRESFLNE